MIKLMRLIFTTHAKIRIQQRKISEEDIRTTLLSPDRASQSFKGRTAVQKNLARGMLEVIYREHDGDFIIITCYWLKEA